VSQQSEGGGLTIAKTDDGDQTRDKTKKTNVYKQNKGKGRQEGWKIHPSSLKKLTEVKKKKKKKLERG
jgi:hypothetical protein